MFQPSLTRDDFDTDSAMGVSIFMDDRSMCTFATDEEVSEFVGIHSYLTIQVYPRMKCWCPVYIILLCSALCALHAGCVLCGRVYASLVPGALKKSERSA